MSSIFFFIFFLLTSAWMEAYIFIHRMKIEGAKQKFFSLFNVKMQKFFFIFFSLPYHRKYLIWCQYKWLVRGKKPQSVQNFYFLYMLKELSNQTYMCVSLLWVCSTSIHSTDGKTEFMCDLIKYRGKENIWKEKEERKIGPWKKMKLLWMKSLCEKLLVKITSPWGKFSQFSWRFYWIWEFL